jgi:hypothetical protein
MKSIFSSLNLRDPRSNKVIDLLASMQIMFDEATRAQKTLFEQTYLDRWFTIRPPQLSLTAEGIMAKYGIRVRASIIGNDADTPLRPKRGFEIWSGEIPRMGHKFPMDAKVLRTLLMVYENNRINPEAKLREIENIIMNDARDAYMGCKDAVDEIILKALSNGGIAYFDPMVDNPDGREYMVDYDMPAANKRKATIEWTEANIENPNINVLSQLQALAYEYKQMGIEFGSMLMAPSVKYWLLRNLSVRTAILGTDRSGRSVTEDEFKNLLRSFGLPEIVEISKRTAYQKDGVVHTVNPWNDDVITFLPKTQNGKIGEIQPALEDSALMPDPNVNYTDAGNGILIAKWRTGESTGSTPAEYTQGTWRAIPVSTTVNATVCYMVRNTANDWAEGETVPVI